MPTVNLADGVARSRRHVTAALQEWDAVNLAACERACESLRNALGDLECARNAALAAPGSAPALAKTLDEIRRDAERLARLIDSSQAFYRGMSFTPDSTAAQESIGLGQA